MTESGGSNPKAARDAWLRALARVASIDSHPGTTLPVLIDGLAAERGTASALESDTTSLTYRELAARANKYAHFGLTCGLAAGDVVCLMMRNCPDYLAVWLGLTRIGAAVALINTQLTGELLAHSIRAVAPRLIIVGADCAAALHTALHTALPVASAQWSCWVSGSGYENGLITAGAWWHPLEVALHSARGDPVTAAERALPALDQSALYIFTSGTTGLPKAAKVSHRRVLQWSLWFAGLMDTGPGDRMYNCLPLYHSVGGVVALGATLAGGGTVIIRTRFSASDFWRDVRDQRCTMFQYIGELCRYLVNAPQHPAETAHSLRLACGNGLRPEIWRNFVARFRVGRILEYYAATEGTFSLYNCEGEPGALGRIPPFLRHRMPVELLRFDVTSGEPWRAADGFCVRCGVDEVGEAVGMGRFEGYVDELATQRKILRDVFAPGDAWYRSGDLMRRDARGFYYFVDRVGDTYRWKGENVSTAEVQSVLMALPGVLEGVVYGVRIPGSDGRAGMAALSTDARFDLAEFRRAIIERLPPYARPLFLRLLPRLHATATFKPLKQELQGQAFDPGLTDDPLFFDSPTEHTFVRLDAVTYARLTAGGLRV